MTKSTPPSPDKKETPDNNKDPKPEKSFKERFFGEMTDEFVGNLNAQALADKKEAESKKKPPKS